MCRNYYPGALKRMGHAIVLTLSALLIKFIITLDKFQYQSEELVKKYYTPGFQNASQGISYLNFHVVFLMLFSLKHHLCPKSSTDDGYSHQVSYVMMGLFMLIGKTLQ